MPPDHYNNSDITKLYKQREDGTVGLLEIHRSMFSDADSFIEALDHYYAVGYHDSPSEAREHNAPSTDLGM